MRFYTIKQRFVKAGIVSLILCMQLSCSQKHKDKEAKADITVKAKSDPAFAGVRFVINNGVITLNGNCPIQQTKDKVESTVKDVYGIQQVVNDIQIAPVIIGTDQELKQSVDSILGQYPNVEAIVKDSMVQLQGQIQTKDEEKLLSAIQSLQPARTENQLIIK